MKRENYPIEGICIAAGVPSPENASEILEQCQKVGLRHVAFKPGELA
jgi:enoyl reductase-like protein